VEGAQSYAVKRQKPGEDGFIKVVSNLHLPEWVDRDAAAGPARTYIINCTGRNGKNVDSAPVTAKISGDGLPAPWALRTWGKAGPGKAGFGNGTLTIEAPDDSTSWAWETLTRDAVMLIHLKKGGGHTGIRVQRTLDSDSPSLFLGIGAKGRSIMSWVASGDQADAREEGEIAAPCWFKLTRSRERYSGAVSTDGVSWSLVGETSVVPLGGPVYVGLVTSSGEAEFDGISFPLPPPPVSAAGSKVD
jgi:hypothetical protein